MTDKNEFFEKAGTIKQKIDRQKEFIKQQSDELILEAIEEIGGGNVDKDKWSIRGLLIDEMESRKGGEFVDSLMDELGL